MEKRIRRGYCKCGKEIETERPACTYCRSCHNAYMRKNRLKHSELSISQRKKANCRSYSNVLVRKGMIAKKPCEICGETKVEIHHEDYSKPRELIFVCKKHHKEIHKKKMEGLQEKHLSLKKM